MASGFGRGGIHRCDSQEDMDFFKKKNNWEFDEVRPTLVVIVHLESGDVECKFNDETVTPAEVIERLKLEIKDLLPIGLKLCCKGCEAFIVGNRPIPSNCCKTRALHLKQIDLGVPKTPSKPAQNRTFVVHFDMMGIDVECGFDSNSVSYRQLSEKLRRRAEKMEWPLRDDMELGCVGCDKKVLENDRIPKSCCVKRSLFLKELKPPTYDEINRPPPTPLQESSEKHQYHIVVHANASVEPFQSVSVFSSNPSWPTVQRKSQKKISPYLSDPGVVVLQSGVFYLNENQRRIAVASTYDGKNFVNLDENDGELVDAGSVTHHFVDLLSDQCTVRRAKDKFSQAVVFVHIDVAAYETKEGRLERCDVYVLLEPQCHLFLLGVQCVLKVANRKRVQYVMLDDGRFFNTETGEVLKDEEAVRQSAAAAFGSVKQMQRFYIALLDGQRVPKFTLPPGRVPRIWQRAKREVRVVNGCVTCDPDLGDRDIWVYPVGGDPLITEVANAMRV